LRPDRGLACDLSLCLPADSRSPRHQRDNGREHRRCVTPYTRVHQPSNDSTHHTLLVRSHTVTT
jgi:hypothetical protein